MTDFFTPDWWEEAKLELSTRDPVLARIIASYHGEEMQLKRNAFHTLARAIIGQQISVKAADSVWARVQQAIADITPLSVANADSVLLRSAGLSNSKVIYLHALAAYFLEHQADIAHWPNSTDAEVIKALTSIKGIGKWTAEMFLIFHLARPDVFPLADLGLLKGIYRHYNNSEKMPLEEVVAVGETWKPWRSLGTWYMWRVLDPIPVIY